MPAKCVGAARDETKHNPMVGRVNTPLPFLPIENCHNFDFYVSILLSPDHILYFFFFSVLCLQHSPPLVPFIR